MEGNHLSSDACIPYFIHLVLKRSTIVRILRGRFFGLVVRISFRCSFPLPPPYSPSPSSHAASFSPLSLSLPSPSFPPFQIAFSLNNLPFKKKIKKHIWIFLFYILICVRYTFISFLLDESPLQPRPISRWEPAQRRHIVREPAAPERMREACTLLANFVYSWRILFLSEPPYFPCFFRSFGIACLSFIQCKSYPIISFCKNHYAYLLLSLSGHLI